jgi:hypothetical protein
MIHHHISTSFKTSHLTDNVFLSFNNIPLFYMSRLQSDRLTPPSTPPPRKTGLTWADFQYGDDVEDLPDLPEAHSESQSSLDETAAKLRRERLRFTKTIPNDLSSKVCCPRDRGAVLDIYAEALSKMNSKNHKQIYAEATMKIKTILGILKAGPRDEVFTEMLLAPIEPLYAKPRIEFRKDKYGHRAATRLQRWRKDGWPSRYPKRAVQEEKAKKGKFQRWYDVDWEDEVVEGGGGRRKRDTKEV